MTHPEYSCKTHDEVYVFNYDALPILRNHLPHTGRLDGDDTGYRDVAVTSLDRIEPDPLSLLNARLACYPVYAYGAKPGITPFYGHGLGADWRVLAREPVVLALEEADSLLVPYNRRLLVLDGWRSADVQSSLWRSVLARLAVDEGSTLTNLSGAELIRLGRRADDTASFCRIAPSEALEVARAELVRSEALDALVEQVGGCDREALASELLTYQGNLGLLPGCSLDSAATTAHGSGGACDLWLVERDSGRPVNLGVPFDSTATCAVMDYFEWAELAEWQQAVASDHWIQDYFTSLGLNPSALQAATFEDIRRERRILFHSLRAVGATYFSLGRDAGEPWHFNFGNERGGRQASVLPGAGSACHSLLKNVRDPESKRITAAWSNEVAHQLAAAILR